MQFEPVRFRYEAGDFIAVRQQGVPRRFLKGLIIAAIVLVALQYWRASTYDLPFDWEGVLYPLGFAVLLMIAIYSLYPRQVRQLVEETKAYREEIALVLNEDGFSTEQASGTWTFRWDDFVMWTETRDIFAVHPNTASFLPFRKDALGEERIRIMRDRLIASGLNSPGKHRK